MRRLKKKQAAPRTPKDYTLIHVNGETLEIEVRSGSWIEVSEYIFRSWGGARRINGNAYHGPVFYLGTDTIAEEAKNG